MCADREEAHTAGQARNGHACFALEYFLSEFEQPAIVGRFAAIAFRRLPLHHVSISHTRRAAWKVSEPLLHTCADWLLLVTVASACRSSGSGRAG